MENFNIGVEIEKKYIIEMPSIDTLSSQSDYSSSEILQIYIAGEEGETRRIRRRTYADRCQYTETRKIRLNATSSTEMEREISPDEFTALNALALADRKPIHKTRHIFTYKNQLFEIDVYPEWQKTAIMETELDSADMEVEFPSFIKIVRDVTGAKKYSNAGMSKDFPKESI